MKKGIKKCFLEKESEKLKLALGIISGRLDTLSISRLDFLRLGLSSDRVTSTETLKKRAEDIIYEIMERLL